MSLVGMEEERRISAMYTVGNAHRHLSLVGDGGGGGRRGGSLAYTQWEMLSEICPYCSIGGEVDLSQVCHWGSSLTNVLSGGWERRGGSLACMQ